MNNNDVFKQRASSLVIHLPNIWTLLLRRLFLLSLLFCGMHITTGIKAQSITLSLKRGTLATALDQIKKQTKYDYSINDELLKTARPITAEIKNTPFEKALQQLLKDQPITYEIIDNTIILREKKRQNNRGDLKNHKQIGGTVTDSARTPLQGVTILIPGTSIGTRSDQYGNFRLVDVGRHSEVSFRLLGYESQLKTIEGEKLDVILHIQHNVLSTVDVNVNTGYQSLPKERATGSFVLIDSTLLNRKVSTNILDRLDGITSGLTFNSQNLKVMRAASMEIHGRSTIFANAEPLIILDNFPYDGNISDINPNDIENITVLKDAAAASIWGARAGNGVIVITSKNGHFNNSPKIQLNASLNIGGKPDLYYLPQLSSEEVIGIQQYLFSKGAYDNQINNGYSLLPDAVEIFLKSRSGLISKADSLSMISKLSATDTRKDLSKYFYRKSINQQYQLNINGGSEIQRYFVSAGYDKNLGSNVGNSFDRMTINANNTYLLLNKKLEISSGIFYVGAKNIIQDTYNNIYPYQSLADTDGNALVVPNNLRLDYIKTAGDGKLLDWYYRPLQELRKKYSQRRTDNSNFRLNFSARYNILANLHIAAFYNYERGNSHNILNHHKESFFSRDMINTFSSITDEGTVLNPVPVGGIIDDANSVYKAHTGRAQLNYTFTRNNHEFTGLLGSEIKGISSNSIAQRMYGYNELTASNQNAGINYRDEYPLFYGNGSARIENGSFQQTTDNRYLSYYFNGSYSYLSRYIFSFSARRDESNLFGVKTNQKGVPLWSTGASWNIGKENFYHINWLPKLKAGVTFGYMGNIDNTMSAYLTAQKSSGYINTYGNPYAYILNPPNPSLRWEKVQNLNMNMEFSTAADRIKGRVDFWTKKGSDLIGSSPIAPQTGIVQFRGNSANTFAKGLDVQLEAKILSRGLHWTSTLLYNYVQSRVAQYKLASGTNYDIVSAVYNNPLEGYPLFSVFSFKYSGLDTSGNPVGFLDGQSSTAYAAINNSVDRDGLVYNGSAVPTSFGSIRNDFRYKNFELSVNIQYRLGYNFRRRSITSSVYGNDWKTADYGKQWQKESDELNTDIPTLLYPVNGFRDNIYTYSSSLVEKGDHFRLQDIRLGYTLSRPKKAIRNINIYLYASNLGILWKRADSNLDPDFPNYIPNPKTFALGIKTDF